MQVYTEPYGKRHLAGRCSAAYCFPACTGLLFLVVAFAVAFSTGQLWLKEHTYMRQPELEFTYETLLLLETETPGEERIWTSIDEVNELFYSQLAAVDVQAVEHDLNFDGKIDIVDVRVKSHGVRGIKSVKLLLGFDYKVGGNVDLDMRTLAYIHHASPQTGAALHVDGDLRLVQREPITQGSHAHTYKGSENSPFAPLLVNSLGTTGLAKLGLNGVLNLYLFRNETTVFDYNFPVWQAGSGDEFEVNARIRVPSHQEILYRPAALTVAKFGWIQFFCLAYPLLWILSKAEWVVFHYQILHTRVVSDLTPKTHRF